MFGYKTFGELFEQVFKHFSNELVYKYFIPAVVILNALFNFLFASANGVWFLILLYCIDFLTGIAKSLMYTIKARRYSKKVLEVPKDIQEKVLVSKKFPRFLLTLLAAMLILAILKFAAIHSIVFLPLYSIFYAVFVGQNIISVLENLHEMKLVPYSVLKKLKTKINAIIYK